MYFRSIYTIKEFHVDLQEDQPIVFNFKSSHNIVVKIKYPTKDEYPSNNDKTVFCVATLQQDTKPEFIKMFESILNNRLPEGSTIPDKSSHHREYINEDGFIDSKFAIPSELLPMPFQEYSKTIFNELGNYIKQTILTIRWRYNIPEQSHNPFASLKQEWSFDGQQWQTMPYSWHVSMNHFSYLNQSVILHEEVKNLVNEGINEPLAHELFREAWKQIHINPRSSLIVGIASAETGFKNLVSELVPNAKWLISEIQSPPLKRMIKEYLPLLPIKNKIGSRNILFPEKLVGVLDKGVSQRNNIVHGKNSKIEIGNLVILLNTIQDFLWALDYYRGNTWAVNYISEKTLEEWDS